LKVLIPGFDVIIESVEDVLGPDLKEIDIVLITLEHEWHIIELVFLVCGELSKLGLDCVRALAQVDEVDTDCRLELSEPLDLLGDRLCGRVAYAGDLVKDTDVDLRQVVPWGLRQVGFWGVVLGLDVFGFDHSRAA
jgi:hypothetical protein